MKVEDEAVRKGFMVHDVLDCPEQNPFYWQQCTRQQEMRRGYEAASQGSAQICMNSAFSRPIFSSVAQVRIFRSKSLKENM